MGRKLHLSDAEVEIIKAKIKLARKDAEAQRLTRKKNTDAYYRMPLGNEKDGRSRIIDTAVFNHISGLHPHLMRRFLATDLKIKIKGEDQDVCLALKQKIRDDIHDQGGYSLIDDVLKDGEICHNGTAKMWWNRVWGKTDHRQVTVTEPQLMQLVEDPRFSFSDQDITPQPVRSAEVWDNIPVAGSPQGTSFTVSGAQMFAVNVAFTPLTESGPIIAAMPPEEFICERGKARINDRYGVGHVRRMMAGELQRENERRSTPDEPYYDNLKDAVDKGTSGASMAKESSERTERDDLAWSGSLPVTGDGLRKECEVIEWCDWVIENEDTEGGGLLVPAFLTFCNDSLIRPEENEDGIIPYSTWTPIPTPHSIIGQAVAAPHVDSQNTRTVVTRALLDNLAFSVDLPRWVKNRGTDMLGLTNLAPGKLLFGNPEDAPPVQMGEVNQWLFKGLEYLKAEGEERGPTTRFNQGTDGGPGGNDTATGISIVQRASFSKIDLIAMAFSELFLVDLYNKVIVLYQKNLDLPVIVKVDGKAIELTKKSIQGRYTAHSDLGANIDFDDRAFQQANVNLKMMTDLLTAGLYPFAPEAIREALRDVFVAGGKTDPSKYMEVMKPPTPGPPGPSGAGEPATPPPGTAPRPPQGAQGQPGPPGMAPGSSGDGTLVGGADNPGAGMGVGQ